VSTCRTPVGHRALAPKGSRARSKSRSCLHAYGLVSDRGTSRSRFPPAYDAVVRKKAAALGTAAFLILVPGTTAGLIPWLLTGWQVRDPPPHLVIRLVGLALVVVGAVVVIGAFVRFVTEGRGTPAPIAPTERLVVGGLYRYVRNPMYLAVAATIVGQALLLGRLELLAYAALFLGTTGAFVYWYEEPMLLQRYGSKYETYRRAVPRWWPRWSPWEPDD
jgi:protein-S-isoprenylcysteine O-methyltransferase Ste14